jgi:hypothetical protein
MIQKKAYNLKHAESTNSVTTRLVEEAFLIFQVVLASGGALGREACEQHHHESDDSGSLGLVSTPSNLGKVYCGFPIAANPLKINPNNPAINQSA